MPYGTDSKAEFGIPNKKNKEKHLLCKVKYPNNTTQKYVLEITHNSNSMI
jgi:hypothetical protein